MCGFAGVLSANDSSRSSGNGDVLRAIARTMTARLRHRGPDADGMFASGPVGLGHRRLSILDLSETGAQPMELRPGGPVIVYNGECYNFGELRRELEGLGHVFRGRSDTEVVLHV